jgi:hypothetical protein
MMEAKVLSTSPPWRSGNKKENLKMVEIRQVLITKIDNISQK